MEKETPQGLRELAASWTCNPFSVTNHDGDPVALLRKVAASIEELGPVHIMDITYRSPPDPSITEITMSVYFSLDDED
ncbi:MAG TPA: hypothetical protein VH877_02880 [Polyangia bacterium]|jgi:hypothetical protein|nr:hypothetical protein [Polyangia bacterium]